MKALLIIDAQYDFMPAINGLGGALAVPDGHLIVPEIELLIRSPEYGAIIATQDWHPGDHCSFIENGGPWPRHCVQGTYGAKIHDRLNKADVRIVRKGLNKDVDSYSGFWDNERRHETELDAVLKTMKVDEVHLVGLALDYCVKFTAFDAVASGYKTLVILNACKGVNINPNDCDKAIAEMTSKGVLFA